MRDPLTAPSRLSISHLFSQLVTDSRSQRIFLLALGFALCTSAYAQDQSCRIPAGQDFWIRLTGPVATYSSKRGAAVHAVLTESPSCDDAAALPLGVAVEGHVANVRRVGLGFWHGSSALTIIFDKISAGEEQLAVETQVQEIANAREHVKAGVIQGIGGKVTPQQILSERLLHLPFWEADDYWIYLLRRGAFPFSPEPEIYLPPGTDLRLRLTAPIEIPAEFVKSHEEEETATPDPQIDDELRAKLLSLPTRTVNGKGKPSDVVNLAFLGSPLQIEAAFHAAGWTYGDSVSALSVLREARALSSLSSYAHLPISKQWLAGKAPDIRLEKSFDSYQKREHIRIWRENLLQEDFSVGSVIRETSASWSIRSGRFLHHIDPDIDAERESVVRNLTLTGCVAHVYRLERSDKPDEEKNATGDTLWTDGALEVIELNACDNPQRADANLSDTVLLSRPPSKLQRFVRAQTLSIHDLWRSNAIYESASLSFAVVRSLRRRHAQRLETRAHMNGASAAPNVAPSAGN